MGLGFKYFTALTFIMVFSAFISTTLASWGVPILLCMVVSFCVGFFGFYPVVKWIFKGQEPKDIE